MEEVARSGFVFKLGEAVAIKLTNTPGTVEGRSEYTKGTPSMYQVYHVDGAGDAVYKWYNDFDLVKL